MLWRNDLPFSFAIYTSFSLDLRLSLFKTGSVVAFAFLSWSGALNPVGPRDGTSTRTLLGGRQGRLICQEGATLKWEPQRFRVWCFAGSSPSTLVGVTPRKSGTPNHLAKCRDFRSNFVCEGENAVHFSAGIFHFSGHGASLRFSRLYAFRQSWNFRDRQIESVVRKARENKGF